MSAQTPVRSVEVTCPPWCAGDSSEHTFEVEHDLPVQHFTYFTTDATPAVSLEQVGSDVTITVEDDDKMDIGMAERLASLLLEAVRAARA